MKIDWKRTDEHEVQAYASCLITKNPSFHTASHLTVAFKTTSGEWKLGNKKVCWFEPTHFIYLHERKR